MVAILDADKEGFLRSETSLMQTIGRAARHVNAKVMLYAEPVTESMQRAIDETLAAARCKKNTTGSMASRPTSIRKSIRAGIESEAEAHARANAVVGRTDEAQYITEEYLSELEAEMYAAAESLEFERAAAIRDRIEKMRDAIGKPVDEVDSRRTQSGDKSAPPRQPRAAAESAPDDTAWPDGKLDQPKSEGRQALRHCRPSTNSRRSMKLAHRATGRSNSYFDLSSGVLVSASLSPAS